MEKLGRLIETKEELKTNLEQVEAYLNDVDETAANTMIKLIGNGTNFVAYQIEDSDELHFAPSRFVGYLNNSLKVHFVHKNYIDGRDTSPQIDKILQKMRAYDDDLEKLYLTFCTKIGVKSKNMKQTQRKYWLLDDIKIELYEGGVKQVSMSRYERNPEARRRCIEKYGTTCQVCNLNFKDMYGDIGEGFIHVHHITPLSVQRERHQINEDNLIPVCPNCHAMLHKSNLSVEELKNKIINITNSNFDVNKNF